MNLKRDVEYRLAKWIFAKLFYEEKIDKKTYHQYCSSKYRYAFWHKKNDNNIEFGEEYTCIRCGKKFIAERNLNRKYCSHDCYITDRYKKSNN